MHQDDCISRGMRGQYQLYPEVHIRILQLREKEKTGFRELKEAEIGPETGGLIVHWSHIEGHDEESAVKVKQNKIKQ